MGAELQRADFRGCGPGVDCGCAGNTRPQRHGPVASRGGTHRRTVATPAAADGGRRGLHHRRGHPGDGGTKDRFSGEHAARRRVHGEDRSPPAAPERFHFSARDESLCVSRGQVLAPRGMLKEGARTRFPPLFGAGGGLSKLCPQARMLSGESRRPGDFALGGERRRSGFPAEDGNRRSTGKLSSAWQSRGILPCLDQKKARSAPVSRSRAGQSADGDALGLPYLQPATVDPLAQTAAHASHRLDSENRRVRKKTESTRAAQAKKPKSSSRHKNQPARDVSSQLLFEGCGIRRGTARAVPLSAHRDTPVPRRASLFATCMNNARCLSFRPATVLTNNSYRGGWFFAASRRTFLFSNFTSSPVLRGPS